MPIINILESSPAIRDTIFEALKQENLDGYCRVQSHKDVEQAANVRAGIVYIWIGGANENPPAATLVKENDVFHKPFRIGALLDRVTRHVYSGSRLAGENILNIGFYRLDCGSNDLTHNKTNKVIRLTDKERHILEFLARRKGDIVDRQVLLDEIWGYARTVETHTLETHIYRLRQKIEPDPANPVLLLTEEQGYRLYL